MSKNYTVYHLHSMLSNGVTNIDSVTKYEEYVDYASSLDMKALAFSEHGSIFQWVKKKNYIESKGMKYIHAEEFYVTKSLGEKVRDNYHCILIARNYDGVKELNRLSSMSFNRSNVKCVNDGKDRFYYTPRITFDELINTTDNIIITSGCLGGILNSKDNDIKTRFLKFMIKNKHRCFLEIQHHKVDEQIKYNKILYTISQKYDLKLVAGTDTHSLNDKHVKGRSILQKSKNVFFDNEDGWDLTFKSYEELCNAYKEQNALPEEIYLAAIENTNLIADMVEPFELDYSYKYPHLWEEPEKLFKQKIKEGIVRRGVNNFPNKQEYFDRIKYEMKAYKHNEAIDFMLLMEDICSWCSDNDIQIGYGRGSCNGSIIAWLLGITEMDSIKYGLNFDRFMNIERVSLSDIDTDFPPSRRDDVKNYIFNKVGLHCCDIITFNTIALKGSIRDVARALNIPLDIVGNICDNVEDNEEKYREEYPELFELVDIVNGTVVSVGSHPCGSVTCEFSLDDTMGLFTTSTSEYPISQINMKEIDSLNYVKLDLLALDTIELINETCKLAGIERLTPDNVDINDDKVWNSIRDDTTQIFQWEGTGESYIKDLLSDNTINKFKEVNENVDKMTLLSIGNSAIRPAGASYREDLKNGVVRKTGSKAIDDFLSNTFGYLVFQCQIIEFLHKYCGFTMGEADIVRRGFAKKTGTEQYITIIKNGGYLNENKKHYINGFIQTMKDKYNIDKDKSEKDIVNFIQVIEDASSYLFSLNHSQPYSFEGYVSGYLRYYYPLEFLTSAFKINKDRQDKIAKLTEYAKKVGITINPIKFGKSSADYTMDKKNNAIYKGISSIKFCNEQIAEELLELSKNKYNSFVDLLKDINEKTSVNSRQLNILTILNFFSDYGKNGYLLKIIELYNGNKQKKYPALGTCKSIKKDMLDKYSEIGLSEFLLTKYSNKITPKMFSEIDNIGLLNEMCSKLKNESISLIDQVKYEIEYLGYTQYNNDNISDFYYIVTEFKTYKDATKPSIMLHNIKTGKETKARIKKSSIYKANPFGQYSILRIDNFKYDLKKRKNEDGEWVETDEYECVLEEYENMKEL